MAKNPGLQLEEWVAQAFASWYDHTRRTKNSGALHGEGDVHAGPFVIEVKDRPQQSSLSIPEDVWKKIQKAAHIMGKIPLVVNRTKNGVFVTLDWSSFLYILETPLEVIDE